MFWGGGGGNKFWVVGENRVHLQFLQVQFYILKDQNTTGGEEAQWKRKLFLN